MPDEKAQADAQKVEDDHAKTGRPVSPTEDPTVHAVAASDLAKQIDPKGASGATVNAASMDAVHKNDEAKEDEKRAEEDQSLFGKIRRSQLFWVNDHTVGGGPYVGISPQNDPKASPASKLRSTVEPLDMHAPRTGLQVRPKDGDAFVIPDGFGLDSNPGDWGRVTFPDGKPLFG